TADSSSSRKKASTGGCDSSSRSPARRTAPRRTAIGSCSLMAVSVAGVQTRVRTLANRAGAGTVLRGEVSVRTDGSSRMLNFAGRANAHGAVEPAGSADHPGVLRHDRRYLTDGTRRAEGTTATRACAQRIIKRLAKRGSGIWTKSAVAWR